MHPKHLSESKAQGQSPTIILKTCLGTPPKNHPHRPSTPRIPERTSYSEHLASEDRASNVIIQTLKFYHHLPKLPHKHLHEPWIPTNPRNSVQFQENIASSQKWRINFKFHKKVFMVIFSNMQEIQGTSGVKITLSNHCKQKYKKTHRIAGTKTWSYENLRFLQW